MCFRIYKYYLRKLVDFVFDKEPKVDNMDNIKDLLDIIHGMGQNVTIIYNANRRGFYVSAKRPDNNTLTIWNNSLAEALKEVIRASQ